MYSVFSSNTEVDASVLVEYFEDMFTRWSNDSDVCHSVTHMQHVNPT